MRLHTAGGVGDESRVRRDLPAEGRIADLPGRVEVGVDSVVHHLELRAQRRRELRRLEGGGADRGVGGGEIHRDRRVAGALVHRGFERRGGALVGERAQVGDVDAGVAIPPFAVGDEGGVREHVLGEHAGAPAGMGDDDVRAVAGVPGGEGGAHEGLRADRGAVHRLGVGMGLWRGRAVRRVVQDADAVGRGRRRGRGERDVPTAGREPSA